VFAIEGCSSAAAKMTRNPGKSDLRRAASEQVRRLALDERQAFDREIEELLCSGSLYQRAKEIVGYAALSDEVSIDGLLRRAIAAGKRVYLPKVSAAGQMSFAPWDAGAHLSPGRYGVREPANAAVEPAGPCLILVPGRAFDGAGRRLGRGGGYYDSVLPRLRTLGPVVGVAYHCQLFERVPTESHDAAMDRVVTERGWNPGAAKA
jgi:5-formyltetrahydrofolate cyclo-ligase